MVGRNGSRGVRGNSKHLKDRGGIFNIVESVPLALFHKRFFFPQGKKVHIRDIITLSWKVKMPVQIRQCDSGLHDLMEAFIGVEET